MINEVCKTVWEPPTVQNTQLPPVARYSLQPGRRDHQDTHKSTTQPALIAETPVLTG
jgi:hypothetical protein